VAKVGSTPPGTAGERLGQWALYWGVAVSAAAAPGMALLFAPVTTMSARSDLYGRWSTLLHFFPLAHRLFAVMVGLALIGCFLALLGLRAARATGRSGDLSLVRPVESPARFALILGLLNLLFWGSALALSLHLATIYRAWGITFGLR
jgi:hypothetical protein